MTQEQFNTLVRAIVFTASIDSCMDSNTCDGILDALKVLLSDHPTLVDGIDFGSLKIYSSDPTLWEDPEINKELLEMFDGKLNTSE